MVKSQVNEEAKRDHRIKVRMSIVTALIALGFVIVTIRAIDLHCFSKKSLRAVASRQYRARVSQSTRRGRIIDRTGKELAVSLPVPSIFADPKIIESPKEVAKQLRNVLGVKDRDLFNKLKSPRRFLWIKRRVDRELAEKVADIRGIYTLEESKRFYPNGDLAGHVLGAVGYDSKPLAGVELVYNDFLASHMTEASYRRDAKGRFYFSPASYSEQDDVSDLYLTIDRRIQYVAEKALKGAVEYADAKSGTAIVMDVNTGAILAMANSPTFDPNNYSKYAQNDWRNRAITDMIEPGSTFKVLVAAAAIETGIVNINTIFDCENGETMIGNTKLHDTHPHNKLSVADVIKVSSNIGAYKIADKMGAERLYHSLEQFGIGQKTEVNLPGETNGVMRSYKSWRPINLATIAFGQGVSATPTQMVTAFAAVSNGGKLMKPYIVDKIVNNQGIVVFENQPVVLSTPISEETSHKMISILEKAIEEGGTGYRAASKEYRVAGKTGTAQKVEEGAAGYASGKYYSSFIGFAPSYSPKIAVYVGLDEPRNSYWGGEVAAPAFREIIEGSLKHLSIPSSLSKVIMASSGSMKETKKEPHAHKRLTKTKSGGFTVPDLRGSTIKEALEAIGRADIDLKSEGNGLVTYQNPPPGVELKKGSRLTISLKQPE